MSTIPLLKIDSCGLSCPIGRFWIDPWRPVDRAVITHAHGDHARGGSRSYLTVDVGRRILSERLWPGAKIETVPYGERLEINGVGVTFFPAGHLLGSAQVRVDYRGDTWVVSGDYKVEPDRTCHPFEPVRCHTFITESTFGLPIYRWPDQEQTFAEINRWWQLNQGLGRATVIFAYALGKAQRVLAGLDESIGPIVVHGAAWRFVEAYRQAGIALPKVYRAEDVYNERTRALVIAPPSVDGSSWLKKFSSYSTSFASGWMQVRGNRRRHAVDRGFVVSDHADWPGLLASIAATGAERVGVTHGFTQPLVKFLREERSLDAFELKTEYLSDEEQETSLEESV